MKIQIKNRWTLEVIFECEADSMKLAVELAVKCGANLRYANLRYANLSGADLSGADLRGAYLRGAYLSGADLSGAYLRYADLSGADLRGADLSGADLRGAYLSGADLSGADLSGTYLRYANLSGADLSGADLSGAYLSGARYGDYAITITPLQIIGLYWDVLILADAIKIGCQIHSVDEWDKFSDAEIGSMAENALEFWMEHKALIISAARLHSAKVDKVKEAA